METIVRITPELDSNNTYPPDIAFVLDGAYIRLCLEDRQFLFLKTDIEKLVKLANI